MEKIEKIKIFTNINFIDTHIILDYINERVFLNDIETKLKKEIFDDFLKIISTWDYYYEDLSVLDGEYYKIDVVSNLKTYSFTNNVAYPSNFTSFRKWVEELYDNR